MSLARALLFWYDANKRELPWRKDKDPYKIWVSEIMLQQTRVEAVKPYFERWIGRFPTVASLAAASEDEVLQYWQGLGYYSRARNLLTGVREVAERYGGNVPDTRCEIETITGIGEYTAGAILSIAYNKKETAVDGNVLRVFSRLYCIGDDIMRTAVRRQITSLVEKEMPFDRPGDFNQALMDLGATICIPGEPRCGQCPVAATCQARQQGREKEIPVRSKSKQPVLVHIAAGILCQGENYLLRKRPDKGVLAGMWEFPAVERELGEGAHQKLEAMFYDALKQKITVERLLMEMDHTFSHRIWHISFYECNLIEQKTLPDGCLWVSRREWPTLSFAGPHRKMAQWLIEREVCHDSNY